MNPLILSHAKYEEIFERITRLSLEYLASILQRPSFPDVSAGQLATWFSSELPERGAGDAIFAELTKVIDGCRPNSPRFFGYVFGSGEPVAAAADLLTSVLNQNTTAWRSGPTATTLERLVVGWLAEAIGCRGFTGTLTGGGSPANLMALAMAREARLPANSAVHSRERYTPPSRSTCRSERGRAARHWARSPAASPAIATSAFASTLCAMRSRPTLPPA